MVLEASLKIMYWDELSSTSYQVVIYTYKTDLINIQLANIGYNHVLLYTEGF